MLDRRTLLRLGLAAGARVGLGGAVAGCELPPGPDAGAWAATFEPTHDGVLVAVGSPLYPEIDVVVEDAITGAVVASERALATDDTGGTAVVAIEGLAPLRPYRYRLELVGGGVVDGYQFRTAPAPESRASFAFLFGADIDVAFDGPIFDTLAEADADFFLSLGDAPYADDPPGAWTLEEYRARHALHRGDPAMQALYRARSWLAIYDDHEVRNNWDARFRRDEAARIDAGLRAWDEWFPLRRSDRRYRRVRWGALAELFVLDCRLYRDDNRAPDGPGKTMLGAAQKAWLIDGLLASAAPFKIVATSVPLDFADPEDSWQVFAHERDDILDAIAAARVGGVVFLTADQHWFAAHHLGSGFKEIQVGPIAREVREPPPRRREEVARELLPNYGEVRVLEGDPPRLEIRGRDELGVELHAEVVRPGVGAVRVEGDRAGRPFQLRGAHSFWGTTPAHFPYAPEGRYRLRWLDTESDEPAADLAPGGELVF